MKKVRMILSALALVFAVAAALAFNARPTVETRYFILDPISGDLMNAPYGTQVAPGSDCVENEELWCKQEWEIDGSGNAIEPVGPKVSGLYDPDPE